MLVITGSDFYKYLALAVMLLAILFGYGKGRNAGSASGQSLAWTNVPLIALATASLGPSAIAIMLYLGYKLGLLAPKPSGYVFSSFITDLPLDFAVINWPFVALYLTGRLWPNFRAARSAMWVSVLAMALPNVLLLSLPPTMVADVFDAGQGIGIVEAMLTFPIFAMVLSNSLDLDSGLGLVISVLMAPVPVLGLTGWLAVQLIGATTSTVR